MQDGANLDKSQPSRLVVVLFAESGQVSYILTDALRDGNAMSMESPPLLAKGSLEFRSRVDNGVTFDELLQCSLHLFLPEQQGCSGSI